MITPQGYEIFLQQGEKESIRRPIVTIGTNRSLSSKGLRISVTVTAMPGSFVYVLGGTVHSYRFGAGGGEMISITSETSKVAELFRAIDRDIPPGPPDVSKLIAIAAEFGASFPTK